jgi:hypothetical protein
MSFRSSALAQLQHKQGICTTSEPVRQDDSSLLQFEGTIFSGIELGLALDTLRP